MSDTITKSELIAALDKWHDTWRQSPELFDSETGDERFGDRVAEYLFNIADQERLSHA